MSSRLLTNSAKIREQLESRNLYTFDNPYNLDNRQLVNTINTIATVIDPFSSFDLSNTVIGRLIGPNTPIAQIGLVMLAKQFAQTIASNAEAAYLPTINFQNLFDGDPNTKFIMTKKDFHITRRQDQSNIGRILETITGEYNYSDKGNPFTPNSTVADFINNSGKGQLQLLYKNINRNVFKLSDNPFITATENRKFKLLGGTDIINIRTFFYSQDSKFYPFTQYFSPLFQSANSSYINAVNSYLSSSKNGVTEYGNTQTYLDDLGKTEIKNNNDGAGEYIIESTNYGLDDSSNNILVWGRDGASQQYLNKVAGLEHGTDGVTDTDGLNARFNSADKYNSFNIKAGGLLEYTRQLLNSKGNYASFDITRKKFIDTNGQLHFNGSPLDTHPDGTHDLARRHSVADPYNRYAKAIRFDGNEIYNGNENSVIYKTVIPKFHPIFNGTTIDNRNMMFSIENLAAETIPDQENGVAYLKDEFATSIPLCEVGQSGGRLMWFPPYDVRLNETAVARWENTTFVGRGEPVYTYSNSERLATLSFKLLIDYPPQVINYRGVGENNYQKTIADFFAFGGNAPSPQFDTNLSQKQALLQSKINQRDSIKPTTMLIEPNVPELPDYTVYFPNDYPHVGDEKTDIQTIITLGYEDGINMGSAEIDGADDGLNVDFFSNFKDVSNNALQRIFNQNDRSVVNEKGYPYFDIQIEAGATQLYNSSKTGIPESQYNEELSIRRQQAVLDYLQDLIFDSFGKTPNQLHINIYAPTTLAHGSTGTNPTNGTVNAIPTLGAKQERYAKITFLRNQNMTTVTNDITPDQKKNITQLNQEIVAIQNEINNIKKQMAAYSPCIFELPTKEDGYEKGFKSQYDDRFYPIFHTQTPEDFHRRLTFLHQCTRQGPAVRVVSNGITSANNSVFGRQPICILRYGDFLHTKVVIDNIAFDYSDATWDLNPEGRGMQPMIADISIQMRVIGGQSLKVVVDAIQNAASFNYYANSTFTNSGTYVTPALAEAEQVKANAGNGALSPQDAAILNKLRGESLLNVLNRELIPTSTQ